MKRLVVLRHGKAEDRSQDGDFGRRLTDRGERDAASSGKEIGGIAVVPVVVVASDAVRALKTAQIAVREMGVETVIAPNRAVYNAGVHDLMDIVREFDDRAATGILVGHNPGLEELACALCREIGDGFRLTPAAFVALAFDTASWRDLGPAEGHLVHIFHP